MKIARIFPAFAFCVIFSGAATAEITYEFRGFIEEQFGLVHPQGMFFGQFTYDEIQPLNSPSQANRGDYKFKRFNLNVDVKLGHKSGGIILYDYPSQSTGPGNMFVLQTNLVSGVFDEITLNDKQFIIAELVLQDLNKTAFNSLALPGPNLSLNHFTGHNAFLQLRWPSGGSSNGGIIARGRLTYLSGCISHEGICVNEIPTPQRPVETSTKPISSPGALLIEKVTPGDQSVTIAFMPDNDGGSPILGYQASCPGASTVYGPASPLTVRGLTNGKYYICSVAASNKVGTGHATTVSVVLPAILPKASVPGAVTVEKVTPGNKAVTLAFKSGSNGGSPITGYQAVCDNVKASGTTNSLTVKGLTNGKSYDCAITAINKVGASAPVSVKVSLPVPVTVPGAVVITGAKGSNKTATLSFKSTTNGGSPITGYQAVCGNVKASALTSPLTVRGLTNGKSYHCSVTATNKVGTGAATWTKVSLPF